MYVSGKCTGPWAHAGGSVAHTDFTYSRYAQSFFRHTHSTVAHKVNFKKASLSENCTADLHRQQTALSDVKEKVVQHLSVGLAE